MIRDYYEYIGEMHTANTLQGLQNICDDVLNSIGVRYYKYEWKPSQYLINSDVQRIVSCPSEWMCHYQSEDFSQIDPKLKFSQHSVMPAVWTPSVVDKDCPDDEKRFWQHSIDFNLGYGATIPIRSRLGGTGMLCLALPSEKQDRQYILDLLPQVEAMAFHLQSTVEQMIAHKDYVVTRLTDRESEVVKWTACGKTANEISMILNVKEPTILFHLKNAKQKLNVINKHQLTARALALGLL